MSSINPSNANFGQSEDALRLRAVVVRFATEIKDYTLQYEEQRNIVEALGTAKSSPENKSALDILELRERRLDATFLRETIVVTNLSNCCAAEISAIQLPRKSSWLLLSCLLRRPAYPTRRL